MKTVFPDYSQSILSLSNSILFHYGVKDIKHPTLKEADELLKKNYKNVILCLFDGMGYLNMEDHKDSCPFMYSHINRPVYSVFPPTTVAATTAVLSGKSPMETSWLGWDLYFKEIDANVDVFPNRIQYPINEPIKESISSKYIPYENIFKQINKVNSSVTTNYVSDFGDIKHNEDLNKAHNILKDICNREERQFIYFYSTFPDEAMHMYGINSKEVSESIKAIDDFICRLSDELQDTLIFCIADHGLIDVNWKYLDEYPELEKMLVRYPSIEARTPNFFVKDEYKDIFKDTFNKYLGDDFVLFSKEEVLDKKLFGEGKPGPKSLDFIGDYLATSKSDICFGYIKTDNNLKGHHAGITEKEMLVPFIVIEK